MLIAALLLAIGTAPTQRRFVDKNGPFCPDTGLAGDTNFQTCVAFCSLAAHCRYCKCKQCAMCSSAPDRLGASSAPSSPAVGAPPLSSSKPKNKSGGTAAGSGSGSGSSSGSSSRSGGSTPGPAATPKQKSKAPTQAAAPPRSSSPPPSPAAASSKAKGMSHKPKEVLSKDGLSGAPQPSLTLPTSPYGSCWMQHPSGCPCAAGSGCRNANSAAYYPGAGWNRDMYGEKNLKSRTYDGCMARAVSENNWCGTTNVVTHYVPYQSSSSAGTPPSSTAKHRSQSSGGTAANSGSNKSGGGNKSSGGGGGGGAGGVVFACTPKRQGDISKTGCAAWCKTSDCPNWCKCAGCPNCPAAAGGSKAGKASGATTEDSGSEGVVTAGGGGGGGKSNPPTASAGAGVAARGPGAALVEKWRAGECASWCDLSPPKLATECDLGGCVVCAPCKGLLTSSRSGPGAISVATTAAQWTAASPKPIQRAENAAAETISDMLGGLVVLVLTFLTALALAGAAARLTFGQAVAELWHGYRYQRPGTREPEDDDEPAAEEGSMDSPWPWAAEARGDFQSDHQALQRATAAVTAAVHTQQQHEAAHVSQAKDLGVRLGEELAKMHAEEAAGVVEERR